MAKLDDIVVTASAKLPFGLGQRVCPNTVKELCRFGVVGVGATLTHVGVYSAGTQLAGVGAFSANFIAFAVAVVVSFAGNFFWTFDAATGNAGFSLYSPRFAKFVTTQTAGLGLNTFFVWLTTSALQFPSI